MRPLTFSQVMRQGSWVTDVSCLMDDLSAAKVGESHVSLVMATMVVIPRLPAQTGTGCVFWSDIAKCANASEYRDRFAQVAVAGLMDEEYSVLNFYTARILGRKIRIPRGSIMAFIARVLLAIPRHLMQS